MDSAPCVVRARSIRSTMSASASSHVARWNRPSPFLPFRMPGCWRRSGPYTRSPNLRTLAQMNPPVRSADHREGIWYGIEQGIIDVLGSDHAPHTLEEKRQPYPKSPSGLPAVENYLALLLNEVNRGRCTISQVAISSPSSRNAGSTPRFLRHAAPWQTNPAPPASPC